MKVNENVIGMRKTIRHETIVPEFLFHFTSLRWKQSVKFEIQLIKSCLCIFGVHYWKFIKFMIVRRIFEMCAFYSGETVNCFPEYDARK